MSNLYIVEVAVQGGKFHGTRGYARGYWNGYLKENGEFKKTEAGRLISTREETLIIDEPPNPPQAFSLEDAEKIAGRFLQAGYLAEVKPLQELVLSAD